MMSDEELIEELEQRIKLMIDFSDINSLKAAQISILHDAKESARVIINKYDNQMQRIKETLK